MIYDFFDRVRKDYFSYALLAFLASYFIFPTSKMVNNVYYGLLALPALIYIIKSRFSDFRIDYIVVGWLVLFLIYIITGFLSDVDLQYYKHILYVFLFFSVCVFFVKNNLLFSDGFFKLSFWVVACYVLFSAIAYWYTGTYGFGERVIWLPARMSGPIYTSMLISALFSATLPIWIKQKNYIELFSAFVISLFCMSFILQSRTGIVALLFVMLVFFSYQLYVRKGFLYIIVFCVFSLLALVFIILFSESIPLLDDLIKRADSGRFELWGYLLSDFESCNYLVGCGPDFQSGHLILGSAPIQHAHNIFLALLVHTGIVSLLVFLSICTGSLYLSYINKDYWGLYLLSSIVALNFDGSQLIGNPDELWVLILLPIFMIMRNFNSKKAV